MRAVFEKRKNTIQIYVKSSSGSDESIMVIDQQMAVCAPVCLELYRDNEISIIVLNSLQPLFISHVFEYTVL